MEDYISLHNSIQNLGEGLLTFMGKSRTQSQEEEKRFRFLEARSEVSTAGSGPAAFSKVNAANYQEILEHFMLPCA